jgi:hypothetical protein
MKFIRGHLLALAATIGVFAVAAPVSGAGAFTWPTDYSWSGTSPKINTFGGEAGSFGCGLNFPTGVGPAGGTTNQVCGGGLTFIGPSVGQIASVVGPTIIGSTVLAPVTTSAGPVQN